MRTYQPTNDPKTGKLQDTLDTWTEDELCEWAWTMTVTRLRRFAGLPLEGEINDSVHGGYGDCELMMTIDGEACAIVIEHWAAEDPECIYFATYGDYLTAAPYFQAVLTILTSRRYDEDVGDPERNMEGLWAPGGVEEADCIKAVKVLTRLEDLLVEQEEKDFPPGPRLLANPYAESIAAELEIDLDDLAELAVCEECDVCNDCVGRAA